MKKILKFITVLFISLFIFSGCTGSFCSDKDIENIKSSILEENESKWRLEATEKFGDNESVIQDYINAHVEEVYKKDPKACITLTEGEDARGATIQRKTWGDAFKVGLIEGLLVFPISAMLIFFTNLFGGNGFGQLFSIVVVTIIVRSLTFLLTIKSTMQSQKIQTIQPELMEIQNKIKEATSEAEKQRLSMKLLEVYKKHGVNPLSSLLMPFVSFPIFIGVWGAVRGTLVLRSGDILGINLGINLNEQILSFNIGAIILFLIMAAAQFVAMRLPGWLANRDAVQKGGPKKKASSQMNLTYNIMYVMILVAGFALPGAMVIYWIVGALYGVGQTFLVRLINKNKKTNKPEKKREPIDLVKLVK